MCYILIPGHGAEPDKINTIHGSWFLNSDWKVLCEYKNLIELKVEISLSDLLRKFLDRVENYKVESFYI
jgi:hypothetical protein